MTFKIDKWLPLQDLYKSFPAEKSPLQKVTFTNWKARGAYRGKVTFHFSKT